MRPTKPAALLSGVVWDPVSALSLCSVVRVIRGSCLPWLYLMRSSDPVTRATLPPTMLVVVVHA
jgi:hypothetical protein